MTQQGLAMGRDAIATALPRWDGRPVALLEARPAVSLALGTLTLRYWKDVRMGFRQISLEAYRLAQKRAQEDVVVVFCQPRWDMRLQRELERVDLSLIYAPKVSRFDSGGADQITALIREHCASVVVVDNLERLLPRIHWASPLCRIEEARQGVFRGIRRVISGFDHAIEVVLFHMADPEKARRLLDEGLVDNIEEVRP